MNIDLGLWKEALCAGAQRVIDAQDELTAIDARFGDADHGVTMTKISTCIQKTLADGEDRTIFEMMDRMASAVLLVNGGSAGPLWATLLEGMALHAPKAAQMDEADLAAMFAGGLTSLREITPAKVGDKTMMDALIPAVEAIRRAEGDCPALLKAGSEAARAGAENSKNFASKFGRAKSYKEQTIGTPDAGAVSMQYFLIGLSEAVDAAASR